MILFDYIFIRAVRSISKKREFIAKIGPKRNSYNENFEPLEKVYLQLPNDHGKEDVMYK
jgi:hypothetical protein